MTTQLIYNGSQVMSGQPVPFVGRQDSFVNYGSRWADKTTITLHGQITGCQYADFVSGQNALINTFSKGFQRFEIFEDGRDVFVSDYTMVRDINFPQSNYAYILNYVVTLDCYKQDLFSGFYGVVEPVDHWEYEEQKDYVVNLTHTISAKGFNTSSGAANALQNARSFVYTRTGLANAVPASFVSIKSGTLNFCLKDLQERIDRFNGTYSITEKYVADAYYGTNGLLRYTTDFDCNTIEGIARVTINGNIDACGHTASMDTIRARYSGLSLYGIAYDAFTGAGVTGALNSGFISNGITEDQFNRRLTFNAVYDNNPDPLVYLDYSVGLEVSENEITTATFQGTIKGRGDYNTRWAQVQAFYSGLNPFSYALDAYNNFSPDAAYPLNTIPKNESTSWNQFNAEITVSKSWDNQDLPPPGFRHFTYSLHFVPSFERVSFTPLANLCPTAVDQYYVVDMGFKTRCDFSINGNGKICQPDSVSNGVSYVRNFSNNKFAQYCPTLNVELDKKDIGTTVEDVTFTFAWSADALKYVNSSTALATVQNLLLK